MAGEDLHLLNQQQQQHATNPSITTAVIVIHNIILGSMAMVLDGALALAIGGILQRVATAETTVMVRFQMYRYRVDRGSIGGLLLAVGGGAEFAVSSAGTRTRRQTPTIQLPDAAPSPSPHSHPH